jgi:two-component system chemotaxis response regulator CheB
VPKRDIIVIGGSAGSLDALKEIVAKLPEDLPAAVFIVLHVSPTRESSLPEILTRAGRLPAIHPNDNQMIEHGRIYIAPPDRHLLIENRHISIVHGPKENRSRPAIDPLFRSAAITYGPRAVGVVLSGTLDDGTAGLCAMKRMGAVTIVQHPSDAIYSSMPESAISNNSVDYIVPAAEIGPLLNQLVEDEFVNEGRIETMTDNLRNEVKISKQEIDSKESIEAVQELGRLSMFTCPECHGTLWEMKNGELLRYRCHVGHAFSIESLDTEQGEKLEAALWSALRALEERGALARRLAKQAHERSRVTIAAKFLERARQADADAETIREILLADPERALIAARSRTHTASQQAQ